MIKDRRRHIRHGKLIPATVMFDTQRDAATGTDVSAGGGFLRTHLLVPVGSIVQVIVQWGHGGTSGARMTARVARVAEPGSRLCPVPGLGVEWLMASSPGGPDALHEFLAETLHIPAHAIDPTRMHRGDGPNTWIYALHPETAAAAASAGDLALPTVGENLPVSAHRLRRLPEQRRSDRFWVRTECVYLLEGLPHAGMIYNLSATGAVVATQQRLPDRGSVVQCRVPLTGRFSDSWIRATSKVLRYAPVSGTHGEGFVVEFQHIDEMGQDGVFSDFLSHLRREQHGHVA
jgi:hypothetical protein